MAWVEIGALQTCCALGFGQGRISGERDRHHGVEGGQGILDGSLVTGAVAGVDGMQASGPHRGAPDRS